MSMLEPLIRPRLDQLDYETIGEFLYHAGGLTLPAAITIFVLVAMFRSNVRLQFFWLPDSNGRVNQPAHFSARELRKLEADPSAVRPLIG